MSLSSYSGAIGDAHTSAHQDAAMGCHSANGLGGVGNGGACTSCGTVDSFALVEVRLRRAGLRFGSGGIAPYSLWQHRAANYTQLRPGQDHEAGGPVRIKNP